MYESYVRSRLLAETIAILKSAMCEKDVQGHCRAT